MAYDNSARAARARLTRASVIAAAGEAFLAAGYAGTTIKAVAGAAGVSPETVYKTFGGKAALLKAVYDVALAGDDEPVPMAQRPEMLALRDAPGPVEAATAYATVARGIAERTGPLTALMWGARATDPDLDEFARTLDGERLAGATAITRLWGGRGWLRADEDRARDVVWTLISPAVHELTVARGWSGAEYAAWLAETLLATVLRR
ncbi:TetR/AcrR family transcriptional regulator [Pseudonocardia pini]|uniref:TetR/AcrR family transcriptional regulator n=1 Tax=Pseudonocardia pini TaxID=2758030 RepID=UPI0015F07719|nr:TetR/AcrR family transcriptional regulator [Pseudonocardia pini]